ncbi:hypothetical protein C8R42DRAFT_644601 [Lentinula raphanica]|nr:hypothetical protein C8R42DRAFT_644601 [Lentinula raphanica]
MANRRSSRLLRALYAIRCLRSTSGADGPGYLYAFNDRGGLWKIGMSNNFVRRKAEWDRWCPSSTRRWMPPIAVARRRRAETLAHLLLEMRCSDRPRIRCFRCQRTHIEIFLFSANPAVALCCTLQSDYVYGNYEIRFFIVKLSECLRALDFLLPDEIKFYF